MSWGSALKAIEAQHSEIVRILESGDSDERSTIVYRFGIISGFRLLAHNLLEDGDALADRFEQIEAETGKIIEHENQLQAELKRREQNWGKVEEPNYPDSQK